MWSYIPGVMYADDIVLVADNCNTLQELTGIHGEEGAAWARV